MNYKTTLVVAVIATAIAALGSAFPMVGTAFASNGGEGPQNQANSCPGASFGALSGADCRQQGFQVGNENTQEGFEFD